VSQTSAPSTDAGPAPRPRDRRAVAHAGAWNSTGACILLAAVCIGSIAIDLASKVLAFRYVASVPVVVDRQRVLQVSREIDPRAISQSLVPQHPPMVVIPEVLQFSLVLNPGAVFGIGPGQRWFFVGFTLLALVFGLMMFARWTGPRDRLAHVGIGLLLGGGLGNLYDRLVYGCVRDFLHPLPGWKWPGGIKLLGTQELWPYVSNLADLFLLIGIGMLLIYFWRKDRGNEDARSEGPAASA